MLADVGQRLLNSAIERDRNGLCGLRQSGVGGDGHDDAAQAREPFRERLDRLDESQVLERGRPQHVRQALEIAQ